VFGLTAMCRAGRGGSFRVSHTISDSGDLGRPRWADYVPMGDRSGSPASDDHATVTAAALAAALDGDRRAGDEVLAALSATRGRGPLLDHVASAAAHGSTVDLELLLAAIDELGIIRGAVRQLVLDPQSVEDVTQDTLIVVAEKIGTFRGDARFSTWLHQIARFKAIDHLRRQRDTTSLDDSATVPSDAVRLSSMIANRTVLRELIDQLPEHYREAVVLRDIESLPYDEIAQRVGIPLGTAKTRVARGRALIAGRLASGAS
jgi:RNA polymerase sigma-70 factor, ECF subfamily